MKKKKVIRIAIFLFIVFAFVFTFGKTYSRYVLTEHFDTTFSSAPFYFNVSSDAPYLAVKRVMNGDLFADPTIDIVVQNYDGANYNEYDVEYKITIVNNSKFSFEGNTDTITKTIKGGSKKNETVSLKFKVNNFDDPTDTITLKIETISPYKKSFEELTFNTRNEWLIQKIEDLVIFSNSVNEGKSYVGDYVLLMNDLDFNKPSDYENPDSTDYNDYNGDDKTDPLIEELQTGRGFIPIGFVDETTGGDRTVHFGGNFDGQEHTISNLYINNNVETHATGFFGYIEKASISNFTLEGKVTSSQYASIAAVVAFGKDSVIDNVTNRASVSIDIGRYQTAGIIANAGGMVISNCKNYGDISNGNHTAGIAAIVGNGIEKNETTITNCKNYGTISNSQGNTAIGGIVGHQVDKYVGLLTIEGCENHGIISVDKNINSKQEQKVGGIIGIVRSKAIINNSTNKGQIVGHLSNTTFSFNGGGIIGRIDSGNAIVRNCHNYGEIKGEYRMGGIVGHINSGGTAYVIDSHNEGTLNEALVNKNGSSASGGILGYGNNIHIFIINSYNKGVINGYQAGGIIGAFDATAGDSAFVINTYNAGSVTSKYNYAGGLFGHLNTADLRVDNTYNIGTVEGASTEFTYNIGYINTTTSQVVNRTYHNGNNLASNQDYGWQKLDNETMHSTSFMNTLNDNILKIDVDEMKDKLISVGLIDENYDIHVHHWEFNEELQYPTIKNEHLNE